MKKNPDSIDSYWDAEIVRRHEEANGQMDDADIIDSVRSGPPELEARIRRRAHLLVTREGWQEEIILYRRLLTRALAVIALILFLLGFWGVASFLQGSGDRINVLWILGPLLGANTFFLLIWIIFSFVPRSNEPRIMLLDEMAARAVLPLLSRLIEWFRPTARITLSAGLARMIRGGLALKLWGVVTHGMWVFLFIGTALGLYVMLSFNSYLFVVETTIQSTKTFAPVISLLGYAPSLLGFSTPDQEMIAASSVAGLSYQDDAVRGAWAGWLFGCIVVYGFLPRLALALFCLHRFRGALHKMRLDLTLPGYARLRPHLLPDSERLGVIDQEESKMAGRHRRRPLAALSDQAVMVSIELGGDLRWPPADLQHLPGLVDGGRLDNREQRHAFLARLDSTPPARLLIAIDPRQTPDRGTMGLIADLADRAGTTGVIPLWPPRESGRGVSRLEQWRAGLGDIGFAPDCLIADADAAQRWMAGKP